MNPSGLSILNQGACRLPGPALLHQLIKHDSAVPALDYLGNNTRSSLTYREFHEAADALAARISRCRAKREFSDETQFVIPVLAHQSPFLYISLLAILKAGGAFCPLNIDAPPERVRFILKDVAATVLLVSRDLASEIPQDISPTIIIIDEEDDNQDHKDADNGEASVREPIRHRVPTRDDLAYVMYTSGSTGTPKGVGISHDAATQALLAHDRHIPSFSRFLQFAAPTFDVSVFEIFFPLFRGVTLVTVRRVELLNDLPAVLRTMDVDACELTPTVAGSLLRKRENAPQLKTLLTIGEMLNAPVVEEFGGNGEKPGILWAMYGPTEATIHCTLQTAFSSDSPTGNIGIPLDTVSCFIIEALDSDSLGSEIKILPIGEVGELAVGGFQLATGYINRPEQTASVFISSPFGRLYRTGDKARLLPDGRLECLGRLSDGQVKLRGQRLELGEVEQAVLRTAGCHSAVAAVVDSILVVFCAVDAGVNEDHVLQKCEDWLPQYMVPGEVVLMEKFPRLPSGKVDRKKLKLDYQERKISWLNDTKNEANDEIEATIIALLSNDLCCQVGRSTSLGAAGLDSLKAIRLASTLRESGLNLSSTDLLAAKFVSDIVFAARSQAATKLPNSLYEQISLHSHLDDVVEQNSTLKGKEDLIEDVLPCTPLQSALLAETAQNADAYWNEIELEITQKCTIEQVSSAFRELARRNEVLRSGFATWQGQFISILFKESPDGQIKTVDEFQSTFGMAGPEDYLRPLRIQILRRDLASGLRVLVSIHHAIYDGWSMDILLSDLSTLLEGQTVALRPSFRKAIAYFNNNKEKRYSDDVARVFWAEHLLGWNRAPLPKLHPKSRTPDHISFIQRRLQASLQEVNDQMATNGCSPQVLFQASLSLLWSGVLGSTDVVIGSVTSGRTLPVAGIEETIGPCIASLPLRVDFTSMRANLDLIKNIQSNNRKAMQHCGLSLSEIKKLANLQPGETFYDVLFAYQESLFSQQRKESSVKELRHLDRLETPILFEVEPDDDTFRLQVTYHSAHFPAQVVEQFAEQFEQLCLCILQSLSNDIRATQKIIASQPSIHDPSPALFQEISDLASGFEAAAAKNPNGDALYFVQALLPTLQVETMSFGELNREANQLAWYLRTLGVETGQVVGVMMNKSPKLYVSILGALKAGCAYLPLLPSTPVARLGDILRQAGVRYCLVEDDSRRGCPSVLGVRFIRPEATFLSHFSTENLKLSSDVSRTAYVIYTSGTTGVPKGVAVSQQNIMANIARLTLIYPPCSTLQPRLLQSCSQAFDVSVFEIFFTWHTGMCLCSGTNDTIFEDLEHTIRQLHVTHLSMTPTVASLVNPINVPEVEFLVVAGEPLTQSVLNNWGERLWQGYGPSETTNICTVKQMELEDCIQHLGHALPGTSTFVLSPGGVDVVPLGWVGELCFGGDQVAQGYLNMPDLTAGKFIHHPRYGRLYRTGDMGRMLPDGSLMILGRMDSQIKLRGQRIETTEINRIATSTDVTKSAVSILVRRERDYSEQLAMFYVLQRHGGSFEKLEVVAESHRSLLAALTSHLPAYMVPSYLIPVSSIPLTASGKVDVQRLQACFRSLEPAYLEMASNAIQEENDHREWTPTEESLADAISIVTQTPRRDLGRWTPLPILGIDSVSAIQLARQIRMSMSARVAVSDILRNQSIAQLARHLSDRSQTPQDLRPREFFSQSFVDTVRMSFLQASKEVAHLLPCTPLQEAMLSRGQRSYYNKVLLRLRVDSEGMKSYWQTMAERHDILRTCFITTNDSQRAIAQVVLTEYVLPWLVFDVTEPSFDVAIHEHLKSLPDPIDSKRPPLSLALIRYRGSEFLSFICHHSLYDAVAMGNLWKEVENLACGIPLLPVVSYRSFVQSVMELPKGMEQFWEAKFSGYRPASLFAQSTASEIDQSTHTTSLELPLSEVYTRSRRLGVSLLSLCQASWANVIALAHNKPDVCFGNVISGRTLNLDGLDRLVAPCFNTIPVRANFAWKSTNIDFVKYFHDLNTDLMPYQFTPLRLVQRLVNRNGRHLFDTLLLFQKPLQDIDKEVWTLEEDSGDMDIPLVCEVVPCPSLNSLVVNIHRDMDMVTGEIAAVLADTFKYIFQTILNSPHAAVVDRTSLPGTLGSELAALRPRYEKNDAMTYQPSSQRKWDETESVVRSVLAELARVPESQVLLNTTIFQLGLDSINAVQIASTLRQKGFALSASDVIECPSCVKIAAKLRESKSRNDVEEVQSYDFADFQQQISSQLIEKLPDEHQIEAVLPCTPIQSAMLASFIQSGGDQYLNSITYLVDETIKLDGLKAAWKSLQIRHPMLRTGFIPVHHQDASFAMVRYHSRHANTPLEISNKPANLRDQKRDFGRSLLGSLQTPPWKVYISQRHDRLTMNLIAHHALYDASSLDSMLDDLGNLLLGRALRPQARIEPAVSAVLRDSLGKQDEAREFWTARAPHVVLNKFPVMTPLRAESRSMLSEMTTSRLFFSELQRASQSSIFSIQAIIQAAWTRVLAAYLGEDSVVFGVALSGRTTDETKDAPFPCLITVPIVASNMASNAELANYMMEYNQALHKHQFSPLSQVQKWLGHPAVPIFDTLLAYQKIERAGQSVKPWEVIEDEAMVEYPISLEIEPSEGDDLHLRITYYDDILPSGQAKLLLRQFDACLTHIACSPTGFEDDIYAKEPELFSILPASSPTLDAPVALLHQFVEMQALINPNKVALEFVSGWAGEVPIRKRWNYRELDRLGNAAARLIRGHAAPRSIVAIHFDKCPEAYFSILGILKAGCSFVALDATAPKARKRFILEDSKAPCLLVRDLANLDFEAPTPIVQITEDHLQGLEQTDLEDIPAILPSDTCYCLYTSGTTGTPKGCEITHDNAVQAMMAFQDLFSGHWDVDSRWLQFAALHFDVSVLEQYWSWSVGITVVAATKDLILDDLTATINRLDITHIDLTPSLARLTHPLEVPSLCRGVFITGGEQLKQEILDAWGSKAVIYNAYGPTEATIGVTMYQRVPINGRPSNIGRQFLNVGSFVFRQGTEIPIIRGGVGELCVSGKLVGKGYLNRSELTAERFPVLKEFGERVYRTGDLVRLLHDGCFDFLGRADDQVKLRGQRLEIAEINHTIRTGVEDIRDTATIVTRHGMSGKDVLVSFVVGNEPGDKMLRVLPDVRGLGSKAKGACRAKLPGYMVPTYVFVLPYIPLSPNNKAEVKELKKLFEEMSHRELMELTHAASPPVSDVVERTILNILAVLSDFSKVKSDEITSSTSIFDLGVDSITSLRLSGLFKARGFQAASPSLLLRHPVVSDLADALNGTIATRHESQIREARQIVQAYGHRYRTAACRELGVKPSDIDYIAPCSSLQHGIISRAMTSKETPDLYFNSFELELEQGVSVQRIQAAWKELVRSESILRTAFVPTTDGFVQVALKNSRDEWEERQFDTDDDARKGLEAQKREWIRHNFSVIQKPLLLILVTTPTCQRLVINIFHAVYDGNSFDLMLEKVARIYRHQEVSQSPPFIEALVYGPLWKYDDCEKFWREHLEGVAPTSIPQLVSEPQITDVSVSRRIAAKAFEVARSLQNVTMQAVVLAVWTAVLQRNLSKPPTVGVVVSGRAIDLPDAARTIGPLFNTVPFYSTDLSKISWTSLIHRCHSFNTSLLEFQHVPLKKIQKWCSGGKAIFDNLFAFQVEARQSASSHPWTVVDSHSHPDYPLAIEVVYTQKGELSLTLVAQGRIANPAKLNQILDQLEQSAASMANSPNDLIIDADSRAVQFATETTELNGYQPLVHDEDFKWTQDAIEIRQEIALLADVDPQDVSHVQTVLELGLDSIDVIKLSAKLKKRSILLPPSQIMRCQSISRMLSELESSKPLNLDGCVKSVDSLESIKSALWSYCDGLGLNMENIEVVLPPTPLQEAMVAGMVRSDFESYLNHDVLEIAAHINIEKLKNAWSEVVQRSPILRTGFLEVEADDLTITYCQVVSKSLRLDMTQHSLNDVKDFNHVITHAKDLARAGKGKSDVFQLCFVAAGQRNFLVLSMAHALYDGWSLGLLLEDLYDAYNGQERRRTPVDVFLPRTWGGDSQQATEFWAQYLQGATPTLISNDSGLSSESSTTVQRMQFSSSISVHDITAFCKKESISLQVLCQACWALVLTHHVKTLDITFGVVVSGRDFDGAENLVFPTMNTIALRCIVHGSASAFLRYLEENMGEIREHQHYPLSKAQQAANLRGKKLFDTLFILQKRSPGTDSVDGMLKSVDGSSATEYPLCIEAESSNDNLIWRIAVKSPQDLLNGAGPQELFSEIDRTMQYLVSSGSSDILSFNEQGVSICGMPPVMIKEDRVPEGVSTDRYSHGVEEWNETEAAIRQVLVQVSNILGASIRKSDTLYHLGLDSISAIKVSSLLRKRDVLLRPQDLVRAISISEMAELASRNLNETVIQKPNDPVWAAPEELPIKQQLEDWGLSMDQVILLPALPMQVYMLSAWQVGEGAVFFPAFQYAIDPAFTTREIHDAWDKLVLESDLLRTVFLATGSTKNPFVQAVLLDYQVPLHHSDSTENSISNLQPFVKATVSRQKDNTWAFTLRIHHALYDGVSLPAIIQRFSALLNDSGDAALNPNRMRWEAFTTLRELESNRSARRDFWSEYLRDCRAIDVPQMKEVDVRERTSYLRTAALPDARPLQRFAAKHGISLQSVFLAAYATILASSRPKTAQGPVVFGIYLANRTTDPDLPLTYPTLNLVPLKVDVSRYGALGRVAWAIQQDIHDISRPGIADVGLWEIDTWSGVQVDSFVNFLSLPETSDEGQRAIRAMPVGVADTALMADGQTPAFSSPSHLGKNVVKGSFPLAVDIEASVHDTGLDIGVFGSSRRISHEEAEDLVLKLVKCLDEVDAMDGVHGG